LGILFLYSVARDGADDQVFDDQANDGHGQQPSGRLPDEPQKHLRN
jgi:hypothetical protein